MQEIEEVIKELESYANSAKEYGDDYCISVGHAFDLAEKLKRGITRVEYKKDEQKK